MIIIEAPAKPSINEKPIRIFLAGGITGVSDWQSELISKMREFEEPLLKAGKLSGERIVLFNPRRRNFSVDDKSATNEQIAWEHKWLHSADIVSFWFAPETLNPITLYELGFWNNSNKPMIIGVHPDYKRREDVFIQTRLARPDVKFVSTIDDLARSLMSKAALFE